VALLTPILQKVKNSVAKGRFYNSAKNFTVCEDWSLHISILHAMVI